MGVEILHSENHVFLAYRPGYLKSRISATEQCNSYKITVYTLHLERYKVAAVTSRGVADLRSGGTDGQTSHLHRLVGKAGEAAQGTDTWARRRRARRTLDDILQSWDHHTGTPPRACP